MALNLPDPETDGIPVERRAPTMEAVLAHAYMLLPSRRRLTAEERAARMNPEPFRM